MLKGDQFVHVFGEGELQGDELWRAEAYFPELDKLKKAHEATPVCISPNVGMLHVRPAPMMGVTFVTNRGMYRMWKSTWPQSHQDAIVTMLDRLRGMEQVASAEMFRLGMLKSGTTEAGDFMLRTVSFQSVMTLPESRQAMASEPKVPEADCLPITECCKLQLPRGPARKLWARTTQAEARAMWDMRIATDGSRRDSRAEMEVGLTYWNNRKLTASMVVRSKRT